MPKTPPPNRGSSRRAAPTKVSKPFPWGTVVGSTVLAVALVGILVYAALNAGSGISDVVRNPDAAIEGVAVAEEASISRSHVAGPVKYDQTPPNNGDHNAAPQQCAVYTEPIAPEHALHSLEHGAVWVTYNDSVSPDDVAELAAQVEGDSHRLLSPVPEQTSPINLSAWGRRLSVDSVDDDRIGDFLRGYTNGPQAPEPGAACTGNTSTGPVRASAPDGSLPPGGVPPVPPAPQQPASPAAPIPPSPVSN